MESRLAVIENELKHIRQSTEKCRIDSEMNNSLLMEIREELAEYRGGIRVAKIMAGAGGGSGIVAFILQLFLR